MLSSLKRKNINFSNSKSSNFFNINTKAKEKINLTVEEDAFILIAAPGEDMKVNLHNPPTDIEVFIPQPIITKAYDFVIVLKTILNFLII